MKNRCILFQPNTSNTPKNIIIIYYVLLVLFVELGTKTTTNAVALSYTKYEYNICNGLSNQLLYHAASIAIAIQNRYDYVLVPDYFIVNGIQESDLDVTPTYINSIPFSYIFQKQHFYTTIENDIILSNSNNSTIKVRFVKLHQMKQRRCAGMKSLLYADPYIMYQIITKSFLPSHAIQQKVINPILQQLPTTTTSNGICVHHRDGMDWHEHCQRWSVIPDGIYRGNCLLNPYDATFQEAIYYRGLFGTTSNTTTTAYNQSSSWIYYCGDHEPPIELNSAVSKVYTKEELLRSVQHSLKNSDNNDTVHDNNQISLFTNTSNNNNNDDDNDTKIVKLLLSSNFRDVSALIDFWICQKLDTFVGNSVSTFSALQIAIRSYYDDTANTKQQRSSYWYNSQSIPLSEMWNVYTIPIVYTYTELSVESGKHILLASITSVRKHMIHNPIHVLYHTSSSTNDTKFIQLLQSLNVRIHYHTTPTWKDSIEQMRLNGNTKSSNLFLHSGNYFGTWQRIDIPLYIQTEYCLLLDSDTIITKSFTLADFGLNLTTSISMSAEFDMYDTRPWNAGVMIMNIPFLRRTYNQFLTYILDHVPTASFDHPSPSDQGAYLSFYKDTVTFLSIQFNFKPYWNNIDSPLLSNNFMINNRKLGSNYIKNTNLFDESYIIHFHGAKPRDYIATLMTGGSNNCDDAISFLCKKVSGMEYLCRALHHFATSVNIMDYCMASFAKYTKENQLFCINLLTILASNENSCTRIGQLVEIEKNGNNNNVIVQSNGNNKQDDTSINNNNQHRSNKNGMIQPNVIVDAVKRKGQYFRKKLIPSVMSVSNDSSNEDNDSSSLASNFIHSYWLVIGIAQMIVYYFCCYFWCNSNEQHRQQQQHPYRSYHNHKGGLLTTRYSCSNGKVTHQLSKNKKSNGKAFLL